MNDDRMLLLKAPRGDGALAAIAKALGELKGDLFPIGYDAKEKR